jgi:polyisoprenoid-binding protein YceI
MATWKLDPDHSSVMFSAKYLMLNAVTGYFANYTAEVHTEGEDITDNPVIDFTAEINSIHTNHPQRDKHLLSADFFDAGNHQQIIFKGKSMEQINIIKNPFPIGPYQKSYHLEGDLTIKCITKAVTLKVEHQGKVTDQNNRSVAGFTLKGILSRNEFGITWGAKTPAGKVIVSDEVRINCSLQFIEVLSL